MNISYEWLRALVPTDATPARLRDLITARVATVDEIVPLRADLAPFVVARVVEAGHHPDSDHLWVTKVDAGTGELLDVVCGAPNVTVGTLYPFAPTGTVMPNGLRIERRKIRGAVSNGMLCSPRELGLGADHEGILALDVDVPPGTPFLRAVAVGDTRLVVDVNPNRPDLLSHEGIAREVGAALGTRVALPSIEGGESFESAPARARRGGRIAGVDVRVDDDAGARRYMAAVVRGVRVGPSPAWLAHRLEAVGARSINNVVDATNYVLHEMGQPVHAFDLAKLAGSAVVVRRANRDEKILTLDGTVRTLAPSMTVIADAERAQAVAGVMGGRESEVGEGTTDLFIEVATFDAASTRATRRALGLSTDASYRFERGVDPALAPRALARVVEIVRAVAGGHVDDAPLDVYDAEPQAVVLALRASRLAAVLGEPIALDEAARLLGSIGFATAAANGALRATVPSWRGDVVQEIDLVEEVARLRGYDSFPDDLRPFRPGGVPDAPQWLVARRVRDALVAAGLLETRPMPFVSGAERGYVRVRNPLAENEAYLRREILESLAKRAEHNLSHMQGDVRLFEIGNVFAPGDGRLPKEEMHVGVLVMGRRQPRHFTDPKSEAFEEAMTIGPWDAKGIAELVASRVHPGASITLDAGGDGGALWTVHADGLGIGVVRRVALDAKAWSKPAYGVEISLGLVESADVAGSGTHAHAAHVAESSAPAPASVRRRYRAPATTPAVDLDLALVVPGGTSAAEVEGAIRQASGDILESVVLVDEYVGAGVEAGARSLAWRLTFRHPERTLSAKEIDGRRGSVLRQLEKTLNVRPRTS